MTMMMDSLQMEKILNGFVDGDVAISETDSPNISCGGGDAGGGVSCTEINQDLIEGIGNEVLLSSILLFAVILTTIFYVAKRYVFTLATIPPTHTLHISFRRAVISLPRSLSLIESFSFSIGHYPSLRPLSLPPRIWLQNRHNVSVFLLIRILMFSSPDFCLQISQHPASKRFTAGPNINAMICQCSVQNKIATLQLETLLIRLYSLGQCQHVLCKHCMQIDVPSIEREIKGFF